MDFLVESWGYLGIMLFLVLTGCGLPIPEEVPIILAGVLSAQGDLDPRWAFAACLIGALVGDSIMYFIGYHFGHGLFVQHPRFAKFLHANREAYFEDAIQRHGFKVMLLARFMVGIRGPVYLAAGVIRMPFQRFLWWDSICATLVVGAFFSLSFAYGDEIATLARDAEVALTLVVLAVCVIVGLWWLSRRTLRSIYGQTNEQQNETERNDKTAVNASGERATSDIDPEVSTKTKYHKAE